MLAELEKRLDAAGYACRRDRNLGPDHAALHAFKDAWRSWSWYPCFVNNYVFEVDPESIVGIEEVYGFEALTRAWTLRDWRDRPRPRRRALGGVASIIILLCDGGIADEAVQQVAKPLQTVVGHTSVMLLVDPATSEVHTLDRVPIFGGAIFGPALREAGELLRSSLGEGDLRA